MEGIIGLYCVAFNYLVIGDSILIFSVCFEWNSIWVWGMIIVYILVYMEMVLDNILSENFGCSVEIW